MTEMSAPDTVVAADPIFHDTGSAFMLSGETMGRAGENGFENPFAFYFAGRGGVLGDVDASVVAAAMGWFQPELVRTMWDQGLAVAGAREASRRYGSACASWGRDHLAGVDGLGVMVSLTERVVAAAEGSGLPLFAGWRAEARVDDDPGRAMQLIHVMREWRGGLHLVATTAAGLSPLEAILTNEGEGQARFFGWQGELPDCSGLVDRKVEAQRITNALAERVYERALSGAERAELVSLLASVKAAVVA
jgi:hypothetical protein